VPSGLDNLADFFTDPDLVSGFVGEKVPFALFFVDKDGNVQDIGPSVVVKITYSSSVKNPQVYCSGSRCNISGDSIGTVIASLSAIGLPSHEVTLVVVPKPISPLSSMFIGMADKTQGDNGQTLSMHFWSTGEFVGNYILQTFYGKGLPLIASQGLTDTIRQGEMRTILIKPVLPKTQLGCIPGMLQLKDNVGPVLASGSTEICVKVFDRIPPVNGSTISVNANGQTVQLKLGPSISGQFGSGTKISVVLTYGSKFLLPLASSVQQGCDSMEIVIGPSLRQGFDISLPKRQYNVALVLEYADGKTAVYGTPHGLSVPNIGGRLNLK
jgi:hypothetical protein